MKIKEWIVGILVVAFSGLGIFWLFGGPTEPTETSQAETRFLGVLSNRDKTFFTGNVPISDSGITWWIASTPKFNPAIHYLVSVDTAQFERKLKLMGGSLYSGIDFKQAMSGIYCDTALIYDSIEWSNGWTYSWKYCNFDGWQPILDSTWEDKKHPLVTPEEYRKLKEILND